MHIEKSHNFLFKGGTIVGDKGMTVKDSHDFNVEDTKVIESSKPPNDDPSSASDKWYQKPIGIVILTVAGIVVAAVVIAILHNYFPAIH